MKNVSAVLILAALAVPAFQGPALAQDEPARLTGRTAPAAPLSSRAMPAAPSIHRLSIGPLSNGFAAPPADDAAPGAAEVSVERLAARARQGDPEANYRMGLRYLSGDGVTRDMVEAFARIRLAAEAGHPRAVSLFYTLGAKLTADEHHQAFERSQALRPAASKDGVRARSATDAAKQ
jgi:TPR repeat protein